MSGCPLSNLRAVPEQRIVLENERCAFVQMPQRVLIGSGLIVPKAHRETVFVLTPMEWSATYDLLHEVKALLGKEHAPDGCNIGWNCGAVAGQHIFHAYLHVIPRFGDEPFFGKSWRLFASSFRGSGKRPFSANRGGCSRRLFEVRGRALFRQVVAVVRFVISRFGDEPLAGKGIRP